MIGFALIGAGRIGNMHGGIIASHPEASLLHVYDVYQPAAVTAAKAYGARVAETIDQIFEDSSIEAILIASSTDTHVDLLLRAVKAGKAVLCEKPISLAMGIVEACREEIIKTNQPIQIGFNRRFDPNHRALQNAIDKGEIGDLEQLTITSRDPGLPPLDYLKVSGGIFRDMLIHDFDMARFILAEEPVEIQAMGSVLVDERLEELGDIDSVMVTMKTASGKQCHINASRRATYGYDQRIEALGSLGMLQSNNPLPTTLSKYNEHATQMQVPLCNFFIERYRQAYHDQINGFIEAIVNKTSASPSFEDGYRAQLLSEAGIRAFVSGTTVRVNI